MPLPKLVQQKIIVAYLKELQNIIAHPEKIKAAAKSFIRFPTDPNDLEHKGEADLDFADRCAFVKQTGMADTKSANPYVRSLFVGNSVGIRIKGCFRTLQKYGLTRHSDRSAYILDACCQEASFNLGHGKLAAFGLSLADFSKGAAIMLGRRITEGDFQQMSLEELLATISRTHEHGDKDFEFVQETTRFIRENAFWYGLMPIFRKGTATGLELPGAGLESSPAAQPANLVKFKMAVEAEIARRDVYIKRLAEYAHDSHNLGYAGDGIDEDDLESSRIIRRVQQAQVKEEKAEENKDAKALPAEEGRGKSGSVAIVRKDPSAQIAARVKKRAAALLNAKKATYKPWLRWIGEGLLVAIGVAGIVLTLTGVLAPLGIVLTATAKVLITGISITAVAAGASEATFKTAAAGFRGLRKLFASKPVAAQPPSEPAVVPLPPPDYSVAVENRIKITAAQAEDKCETHAQILSQLDEEACLHAAAENSAPTGKSAQVAIAPNGLQATAEENHEDEDYSTYRF